MVKHPRLLPERVDTAKIAVRTKWQFGSGYGDVPQRRLKGNFPSGDGEERLWEIRPNLRRKIDLPYQAARVQLTMNN